MKNLAYISGILLGLCALPEVIHSINKGRNDSSWIFLLMWLAGEIGFFIYVLPKKDTPLLLNYVFNILLISILIYFKL